MKAADHGPLVEAVYRHGLERQLGVRLMIMEGRKDEEAFRRVLDWEADVVNCDHGDLFQKVAGLCLAVVAILCLGVA